MNGRKPFIKKLQLKRETIRTGIRAGGLPEPPHGAVRHGTEMHSSQTDSGMGGGNSGMPASSPDPHGLPPATKVPDSPFA